jgi:hypothetical protein
MARRARSFGELYRQLAPARNWQPVEVLEPQWFGTATEKSVYFIVAYPNFLATLADFTWADDVSFYQETTGTDTHLGEAFALDGWPSLNGPST